MSRLVKYVALVSESQQVPFSEVAKIAAALQKQVTRDFGLIWDIDATIDAYEKLEDVSPGCWPIIIRDDIGVAGAAGIHMDEDGQPYALVQASERTPLTCSHELLEMLADPFGTRLVASDSIKPGQGRVRYLVEVCDPSEGDAFGYTVNGILLSDFYTPNFFDPVAAQGVRYSFTGAITKPKQILKDGYLSWMDEHGKWWQGTFFGSALQFNGPYNWKRTDQRSWREVVDMNTRQPLEKMQGKALMNGPGALTSAAFFSKPVTEAANVWASGLHAQINALIAKAPQ